MTCPWDPGSWDNQRHLGIHPESTNMQKSKDPRFTALRTGIQVFRPIASSVTTEPSHTPCLALYVLACSSAVVRMPHRTCARGLAHQSRVSAGRFNQKFPAALTKNTTSGVCLKKATPGKRINVNQIEMRTFLGYQSRPEARWQVDW